MTVMLRKKIAYRSSRARSRSGIIMRILPINVCASGIYRPIGFSSHSSLSISRFMLLHYKCKQNNGLRQDKRCNSELFKTILKFCEIKMLHGHIGDSNIIDQFYRKCQDYYSADFVFGQIHVVLHWTQDIYRKCWVNNSEEFVFTRKAMAAGHRQIWA